MSQGCQAYFIFWHMMFYGMISYNNRSITPLLRVPPSQLHALFCPKLNHYLLGKSVCVFSEGQVVRLCTGKRIFAWLFIGAQIRGNTGWTWDRTLKERAKEHQLWRIFLLLHRFFLLVIKSKAWKVLVTPKQFNHCFDNSHSPSHSSSSYWSRTTVDLSVLYAFHPFTTQEIWSI